MNIVLGAHAHFSQGWRISLLDAAAGSYGVADQIVDTFVFDCVQSGGNADGNGAQVAVAIGSFHGKQTIDAADVILV